MENQQIGFLLPLIRFFFTLLYSIPNNYDPL